MCDTLVRKLSLLTGELFEVSGIDFSHVRGSAFTWESIMEFWLLVMKSFIIHEMSCQWQQSPQSDWWLSHIESILHWFQYWMQAWYGINTSFIYLWLFLISFITVLRIQDTLWSIPPNMLMLKQRYIYQVTWPKYTLVNRELSSTWRR